MNRLVPLIVFCLSVVNVVSADVDALVKAYVSDWRSIDWDGLDRESEQELTAYLTLVARGGIETLADGTIVSPYTAKKMLVAIGHEEQLIQIIDKAYASGRSSGEYRSIIDQAQVLAIPIISKYMTIVRGSELNSSNDRSGPMLGVDNSVGSYGAVDILKIVSRSNKFTDDTRDSGSSLFIMGGPGRPSGFRPSRLAFAGAAGEAF